MIHRYGSFAAAALAWLALPAMATYHTWKIEQLYSNADGTLQFIVLHESEGEDGENLLRGHTLTSTRAGVTKTYTFNRDLPGGTGGYYGAPSPTANKRVLIATAGIAQLGPVPPDYLVPERFLATDGATLDFAGADRFTHGPLPTDGVNALFRDGTKAENVAVNFANDRATIPTQAITTVEYYHTGLDHYFITALAPDIDALESGRLAGWAATGKSFRVYATQAGGNVSPVCRYYIPPPFGDSHFFSASPDECSATGVKFPQFSFESPNVFYVGLPDLVTGACPAGTTPVYRVWNQRVDSNHRYTTDRALRDQMLAKGYVAEGYGADAVIMCAA